VALANPEAVRRIGSNQASSDGSVPTRLTRDVEGLPNGAAAQPSVRSTIDEKSVGSVGLRAVRIGSQPNSAWHGNALVLAGSGFKLGF